MGHASQEEYFERDYVIALPDFRYKDDPTILAWELGNELGGWGGPSPPGAWTVRMATFIKAVAPKTLVMDGSFGGLSSFNRYAPEALQSGAVDMFSNHYYYGSSDIARIANDAQIVADWNGKVFIVGEFGFDYYVCQNIYNAALMDPRVSGALIWSLRGHSRDGGFYTHSEGYNYWSYHTPGFAATNGFSSDDNRMATLVRQFGLLYSGLDLYTPFPLPSAGLPIQDGSSITPTSLRWVGSSWAANYQIFRRSSKDNFSPTAWGLITSMVFDNVQSGNVT